MKSSSRKVLPPPISLPRSSITFSTSNPAPPENARRNRISASRAGDVQALPALQIANSRTASAMIAVVRNGANSSSAATHHLASRHRAPESPLRAPIGQDPLPHQPKEPLPHQPKERLLRLRIPVRIQRPFPLPHPSKLQRKLPASHSPPPLPLRPSNHRSERNHARRSKPKPLG